MTIEERRAENTRILIDFKRNGCRFSSGADESAFRNNCKALGVDPNERLNDMIPVLQATGRRPMARR